MGKILKVSFYNSPVAGLEYKTQTASGITNEKGSSNIIQEERLPSPSEGSC